MSMPKLDPARFVPVVLSDASHKVPMPDKGGRFFSQNPAAPETVDIFDPFYAALLADGSIRRACPVAVAQAQAAQVADKPAEGETTKVSAPEGDAESTDKASAPPFPADQPAAPAAPTA